VLAALLATALAAAPAPAEAYDPFEDPPPEGGRMARLSVTAWGGGLLGLTGGTRSGGSLAGGEVAWSFDSLDLGVQALSAQVEAGSNRPVPVLLLRIGQHFESRRGLEGSFTFGAGSARLGGKWQAWFQIGLGGRIDLGPIFLAAELGLEQADLVRVAGGIGVRF
jgi:hypothetical protein